MLVVIFYVKLIRSFFPKIQPLLEEAMTRMKTYKRKNSLSSRTMPKPMEENASPQKTNHSKVEEIVNINEILDDQSELSAFPEEASAEYAKNSSHGKSTKTLRDVFKAYTTESRRKSRKEARKSQIIDESKISRSGSEDFGEAHERTYLG